jgi:putative pyoverdin transport system ATP-binding/permease protein
MSLIGLLWRESRIRFLLAIACSALTAVAMMLLLRTMAQYISQPGEGTVPLWAFVLLAAAMAGAQLLATWMITSVSTRTVRKIRLNLAELIASAPIAELEKIGESKLVNGVTEDSIRIAAGLPSAVALTRDVVFAAACLAYLATLSLTVLGVLLGAILIGAAMHRPLQKRAMRKMGLLRDEADGLFALFGNLVNGAKQLKLSSRQRKAVVAGIAEGQTAVQRLSAGGQMMFAVANAIAVLFFVALIGVMMYGRLADFVDPTLVTTFTLIIFFLLSPLQSITAAAQQLAQASTSAKRLQALRSLLVEQAELAPASGDSPSCRTIVLEDVTYAYPANDRKDFRLGPISLAMRGGRVLFVVGGNGSGKTTFVKLLCGLYAPSEGRILMDGAVVDDPTRPHYREQIAGVFSDACLLEGLSGSDFDEFITAQRESLRYHRLEHAVNPKAGVLAQARSFSSGEKKRLALLLASADERQIFVFDEYAANQDPDSKDFFYRVVLAELKAKGKIVVVVSHDDRFYSVADYTLVLERGMPPRVIDDEPADSTGKVRSPRAATG